MCFQNNLMLILIRQKNACLSTCGSSQASLLFHILWCLVRVTLLCPLLESIILCNLFCGGKTFLWPIGGLTQKKRHKVWLEQPESATCVQKDPHSKKRKLTHSVSLTSPLYTILWGWLYNELRLLCQTNLKWYNVWEKRFTLWGSVAD